MDRPPPNLTPVLGRYFQREWSHGVGHRLYDTDGRAYLDFANGIAVTALGHAHPRVTAAIHAQVDKLIGADQRARLHGADLAAGDRPRGDVPGPARLGDVPELGLRGDRRRAQARPAGHRAAGDRRVPRRVPRPDLRGHERHDLEPQLPDRLRAAAAGRLLRAVPGGLRRLRRRRGPAASTACLAILDSLFATVIAPSKVGGDADRAGPGRGRVRPGARRLPAGPARALRRARHPAHRRRGPDRLRPDRADVGVRARRDRPGRRGRRQGDRQRPAAVGDRVVARAPGTLGTWRARLDVWRQSGRLRGRDRRPRDDPRRGPRRERGRARRGADAPGSGGSRPRTTGSATSAARA